ncbi:MAG: hypothetical protein ABIG92_03535 [Candidatus Omnitrophota bacterium]
MIKKMREAHKKAIIIFILISSFIFVKGAFCGYLLGSKGQVENIFEDQYKISIKYITNRRYSIYTYVTYSLDDNTIVLKNGKEAEMSDLSRGDIVEVKKGTNEYGQTVTIISIIDSWSSH